MERGRERKREEERKGREGEEGRERKRGREGRERDRGKIVILIIFMILTHTSDTDYW